MQRIVIEEQDGKVTITGPLGKKIITFGMLIMGIFLTWTYVDGKIEQPTLLVPTDLKGGQG